MEKQARYEWIDTLRFLGMLAIYVGHLGNQQSGRLYSFVWYYHVPMMFFVSGLFAKRTQNVSAKEFLKKKFGTIMIPYYVFGVFAFAIYLLFASVSVPDILKSGVRLLFGVKDVYWAQALWFLPALFLMAVLYYSLNKLLKNKWLVLGCCIILAFVFKYGIREAIPYEQFYPFSITYAFRYIDYYAIGDVLGSVILLREYRHKKILAVGLLIPTIYAILLFDDCDLLMIKEFNTINRIWPGQYFMELLRVFLLTGSQILLSLMISGWKLVREVGEKSLYVCGNEFLVKTAFTETLCMLNLPAAPGDEMQALLYCFIAMIIVVKCLVPGQKALIERIKP